VGYSSYLVVHLLIRRVWIVFLCFIHRLGWSFIFRSFLTERYLSIAFLYAYLQVENFKAHFNALINTP
jgi:hypothetical protein